MVPIMANILVEVFQPENNTGLEMVKETPLTGTVISVGEGTIDWPEMKCKPGDKVRWHKNAGVPVKYNGKDCLILNEEKREIIAKL